MFILIAIVVIVLLSARIVQPNHVAVVERLGKPGRIQREGLNFIIPLIEWTRKQTLAMSNLQIEVSGITSDKVSTIVRINVIHQVENTDEAIKKSLYAVDNPVITIKALVEEQLRAKLYEIEHDHVFGKREELGSEVSRALVGPLQAFGMRLQSVQVQDIALDEEVTRAMNQVVANTRLKEAQVQKAMGEKQSLVLQAEAEKETKRLVGEGMADQRKAIAAGFQEAVELIKKADNKLSGKDVLEFLIDTARIETLGNIGETNAKVIYVNESLEAKKASLIQGS